MSLESRKSEQEKLDGERSLPEAPKAIIFDVGGVIATDIEPQMYNDLASEYGKDRDELWMIRNCFWPCLRTNLITEDQYWEAVVKEGGIDANVNDLKARVSSYIEEVPGTLDIVRKLRDGHKLAVISNHAPRWFKLIIKKTNFDALFEPRLIVVSYDVGLSKPFRNIFLLTLRRLEAQPQECLFIDNTLSNVRAAEELGMKSLLFRDSERLGVGLRELGVNVD